jgi:hypothetical protein
MGSSCGACDNQPDGIYLCPGCRDVLIADLGRVEATVEAVWASAARMNVGNGSVGTSGHSAPSEPTNARAYDTGRTLNVILTGWTQALGRTARTDPRGTGDGLGACPEAGTPGSVDGL